MGDSCLHWPVGAPVADRSPPAVGLRLAKGWRCVQSARFEFRCVYRLCAPDEPLQFLRQPPGAAVTQSGASGLWLFDPDVSRKVGRRVGARVGSSWMCVLHMSTTASLQ